MSSTKQTVQETVAEPAPQPVICGGVAKARPVNEEDLKIWDLYKNHLEKKIRDQFNVAKTHELKPVQVSTQVVGGLNYFFRVPLPDNKYAVARIYHRAWEKDTQGKEENVAVQAKAVDNPNDNIGHF